MKKVGIINYGVGNYESVANAVMLAGSESFEVQCRYDLNNIEAIILPGVGHYDVAMAALRKTEMDKSIQDLIGSNIPVIGICLGFHIMGSTSAEAINESGLKIFDFHVEQNPEAKVNTGWKPVEDCLTQKTEKYYFNHGFSTEVSEHTIMSCKTTATVAAVTALSVKQNFCGVQFHLEKSGNLGINMLKRLIQCDF